MKLFEGKVAVVTGGTSGLGQAVALEFARKGAEVAICGRRENEGNATVELIKNLGAKSIFVKTDISKSEEVKKFIAIAVSEFGRIDCAVNSAGKLGSMSGLLDYPEDEWKAVMDVNITGTWHSMKYEILEMLKNKNGSIVNVASVLGIVGGHFKVSAYSASKHGMVGLTKSAALEFAHKGIRINVICPGSIETEMLTDVFANVKQEDLQKARQAQAAAYPMRRITTPEEVAKSAVWLCSDEASFITGVALPVDGGWTAQ